MVIMSIYMLTLEYTVPGLNLDIEWFHIIKWARMLGSESKQRLSVAEQAMVKSILWTWSEQ